MSCAYPRVWNSHISKKKATQGRVFLIYEQDGEEPCWLSQSMPGIVRAINTYVTPPKRLHCSSAYRILRQESLTHVHKHHHIQVFHRDELRELNESISHFPGCICVTKYVDAWYIKVEPEGEEAGPGRLPG